MNKLAVLRKPLDTELYEGHKIFFDATRDILDFSETVIAELNVKDMMLASMSQFDKVLLAWFFRQTLLSKQAWLLASGGQEVGTAIFVRSISEIRIKLEYMLHKGPQQFEVLSEEFLQYGNAWVLKDAIIAMEIYTRTGDSNNAQATQQKITELESRLSNKQRPNQWWPGKQLRQLAEDANILPFYETVFGQYSRVVHSQPAEMLCDHSDPTGLHWTLHSPPKDIPGLLYAIYECYQMMLETVACQFWSHPFKRSGDFIAMKSKLEQELDKIYD